MWHWFVLILLAIGTSLLIFSLRPVHRICQMDDSLGWCVLRALVLFFVLGYLGVTFYFYSRYEINTADITVSSIMFAGGVFVWLVVRLSLKSLQRIEDSANAERHNALHDSLTGLPNRKYLFETLVKRVEEGSRFSLVMIDLNRFKQVNDALGHQFGDKLLVKVGQRIQSEMSSRSTLFRLGGDEFALIVVNVSAENVPTVVANIHQCLDVPFEVDSYEFGVNASIGVAHFPLHSREINTLIQQADIAMYASKRRGTLFSEYDDSLRADAAVKIDIAAGLKDAINQKEFQLWYQPIIELATGKVHGAEALIRWQKKDGSFVDPGMFIKVAEQSLLITKITHWVINKVAEDLTQISAKNANLCIHVNLSVKDLHDKTMVGQLTQCLENVNFDPQQVRLEVTESAMMMNVDFVKESMKRISHAGFEFSVDDFGTGFSSLSLLRELPVGQIKIDREFVKNLRENEADMAIVKSTLYLAKRLDCSVVAEGVEDSETAELLKTLGCNYAQGYYFSKPLELSQFLAFLDK